MRAGRQARRCRLRAAAWRCRRRSSSYGVRMLSTCLEGAAARPEAHNFLRRTEELRKNRGGRNSGRQRAQMRQWEEDMRP
jgi:hypothetical protein